MFDRKLLDKMKAHALECYPAESCGIVAGGIYHRIDNIHGEPEEHFRIEPIVWVQLTHQYGDIQAVIHSHPEGPDYPSYLDQLGQMETAVAWGIVVIRKGAVLDPFFFGDQAPIPDLIGRVFRHGVSDCYGLVRDWYRLERNIVLPYVPRRETWWAGEDHENLLVDLYKSQGFESIPVNEEWLVGDCALGKIHSPVPNHSGVYLGNGLILHHLEKRLSRREPIGPWMKYITHHLRYVGA